LLLFIIPTPSLPHSLSGTYQMRFELVEWGGAVSNYLVHFAPVDAGPPGGPQEPDPLPDPLPEPIGLPVATAAAWGAIPATEWTTRGGPNGP
jgi:hypothetical protein